MHGLPYWRLSSFYFFYFAFVGAFAPYWGLYLKSLEFSAFQIGVLMSLLQVARIFAPNLWGWLADHTGRRVAVVQLAALLSLLFYLGVFAGESFAWLFVVMALMSVFWSASLPLVEAITLGHLGSLDQARTLVLESFATEKYFPGDRERWAEAYGKFGKMLR